MISGQVAALLVASEECLGLQTDAGPVDVIMGGGGELCIN